MAIPRLREDESRIAVARRTIPGSTTRHPPVKLAAVWISSSVQRSSRVLLSPIIRRGEGWAPPWSCRRSEPQWRCCSWSKGGRRRRTRPGHLLRNLSSAEDDVCMASRGRPNGPIGARNEPLFRRLIMASSGVLPQPILHGCHGTEAERDFRK